MNYYADPITQKLKQFIWLFWAILWVSIIIGIGGTDNTISTVYAVPGHEVPGTIASILLWGAVVVQVVKQAYYTTHSNFLIKLGRMLLLVATSIFAFRITYMLVVYGNIFVSLTAIIGTCILAIGLILSSLGVMMEDHFKK